MYAVIGPALRNTVFNLECCLYLENIYFPALKNPILREYFEQDIGTYKPSDELYQLLEYQSNKNELETTCNFIRSIKWEEKIPDFNREILDHILVIIPIIFVSRKHAYLSKGQDILQYFRVSGIQKSRFFLRCYFLLPIFELLRIAENAKTVSTYRI